MEQLKAKLAEQQKQLDSLRQAIADQQKLIEVLTSKSAATPPTAPRTDAAAAGFPRVGGAVASTTGALPVTPAALPKPGIPVPQAGSINSAPLQLQLGGVSIMPVGFMDLTAVIRDKDAGSSLGSNFGSVPFNNAAAANLSEFRFTPQNSRIGFRIDGDFKGTHVMGYNEFDFLGTSGGNNLGVTNGAFVPRLRVFWVDVRKDKFEFLAGQSWSMLTPNRKGLSALPGDIFYSQVVDVNYMAGLPWTRQPGVRFIYHPSSKLAIGVALENPDQYIGGSAGGSPITLPAALASLGGGQFDNATNVLATPNVHPDIIAKIAFDPSSRVHLEVAGIERTFRDWDPITGQRSTKAAGGGSVNANIEVVKNLRLVTNNYWSDGGGRYLFGQAPDVVVRADGSISPIHSGGTVDGFEATIRNTLVYGYYGAIYAGRNTARDANGTSLVGYGYTGSPNTQNRAIQEATIGFNQTLWKDPRYGALNLMGQYEFLTRAPWYVAPNNPKSAHDNTIYINIRYTLPGAPPAAK